MITEKLLSVIVSNLNEIVRASPGTYPAHVAKVTLAKIDEHMLTNEFALAEAMAKLSKRKTTMTPEKIKEFENLPEISGDLSMTGQAILVDFLKNPGEPTKEMQDLMNLPSFK